jgi:fatty acid desaturase
MTYQDLRRQVQAAGLLDRSGWYSVPLALGTLLLGVASFGIVVFAPGAWRFVAVPFLSLFWMQVGFFGHDAGHNQVFPRTEHNRRLGLLCFPFFLGMTFRTWVIKHNLHHVETNVVESDPDIQHPLLAFTEEAARERRGAVRWLVRYQAYAYPFLALFATSAFRFDAWRYALGLGDPRQRNDKFVGERRLELVLLGVNLVLWLGVPSVFLGPLTWLSLFVLAQMLLGFHMAFVFAPNHKGMPMFTEATRLSFLEHQVLTSRNVFGGPLVDFMYGGLNYQVEHHLFPTLPRQNFAACREIVKRFCLDNGVAYTEESVVQSCKSLFSSLNEIGKGVFQEFPRVEAVAGGVSRANP